MPKLRWIATIILGAMVLVASVFSPLSSSRVKANALLTPLVVTPIGPASPEPPADGVAASSVLILTSGDNGSAYTIPLNTLIFLRIPVYQLMRLSYDPTVLQPIYVPIPIPQGGYVDPNETPIPPDSNYPIYDGWRLRAVGLGTTTLSVVNQPCPPDAICPMIAFLNFSVTITVTPNVYPPIPTYPPVPPITRSDVYISTAYLNQTVSVQPGQTITLDLPFLAVGQSVDLQFDPTILTPLRYPYLQSGQPVTVQPGGWQFRVLQAGTTALTVQSACLNGGSDCAPTILFNVTIQASFDGR